MKEYHKIEAVFNRDTEGTKRVIVKIKARDFE